MTLPSNPPATRLPGRLVGTLTAPRRTMTLAAGLGGGSVLVTWVAVLVIAFGPGAWFLTTPVGRQALVDERVRVSEALGAVVDDGAYAALQAHPPISAYFTSGGRFLLAPVVPLLVGAGLWLWARLRRDGRRVTFLAALSVSVHASVPLALQQLLALPFHVVRESLASPFNMAALLPLFDEGSPPARFLGTIELFGLWWVLLLALGASALSGRPARRVLGPFVAAYVGAAAVIAGAVVLLGGS